LIADVAGVVDDDQPSDHFVITMDRECVYLDGRTSHVEERTYSMIFLHGLGECRRRRTEFRCQVWCGSDQLVGEVIYCDTNEVFAIAEALYDTLHIATGIPLPNTFNVIGEAVPQHFCSSFQIVAQIALLCQYLIIRREQRHQCDSHD